MNVSASDTDSPQISTEEATTAATAPQAATDSRRRILLAENMPACETLPFAGGSICFFTCQSPDATPTLDEPTATPSRNEDAIALLPIGDEAGVLLIADGCGGQANGQLASRVAIEALQEALSNCDNPDQLRPPILDGFEDASRRVESLGGGAATTLVALEINAGKIRTYHVGDSQILLVGGKGKVKFQTRAHSPVGYAIEAGMLSEQAALEHKDRHLVSNVMGGGDVHIDIGLPRRMSSRDTVILGSDGLFDNLTQAELVTLIRTGNLLQTAERLRETVMRRMLGTEANTLCKPDDLSFIIFRAGPKI